MNSERVDEMAGSLGYRHIGGMRTNRVYLADERGEILKVAMATDPATLEYATADFRKCLDLSAVYAGKGLMPEVLAVGDDFRGTGYPWLRERYVRGRNLGAEYIADPDFWTAHAPREIARLCGVMAETRSEDVSATWRDKIEGMTCPPGFEDICAEVARAGEHLARRYTTGHPIHGDLQFGNMIARREDGVGRLYLIDWEVSEVMPLGYELAMLYTFLLGPEAQVEERYRQDYNQVKPLRGFWAGLAPLLLTELGIAEDELKSSVVFRMGNGWLYQLDRAIRGGDETRARELERDLRSLVSYECFDVLPYPLR
jgi:hypothetical protein